MIVKFEDKFKIELKTPGNSFKLCTYRLGSGTSLTNYFLFESLWDIDTRILNMSLDLSFLRKSSRYTNDLAIAEDCKYIEVYYSDLNDNILGLAFTLSANNENELLNLCSFDSKSVDSSFWRNMNYINLRFPKDTRACIETLWVNENIDFLEQLTSTEGINTFLVEGDKENDTILTKDSFKKHVRNTISKNNQVPLYLDHCGEKVLDIEIFKYYKKIVITCVGPSKVDTADDGTVTCSVGNRSSVAIKGYCLFDEYKVINGDYTLTKQDQREDLSNATLVRLIGGVETSERVGIEIDNIDKQIKIDDVDGVNSEIDIAAKLTFINKIGTDDDEKITLISNVVRINLFFSWYVEYFTPYTEKDDEGSSHPVILFDTTENNQGWIEGSSDETTAPGNILVYSSKRINTDTGISVVAHDVGQQSIFDEYFITEIEDRGFSETADKFIYGISIFTRKENKGDIWCPIDDATEESKLVLMDIKISDSVQEEGTSAQFYCVQRVNSPLTLGKANVTVKEDGSRVYDWVTENITSLSFENGIGITSLDGLFVCNPKLGYELWEVSLDDDATSNLIVDNVTNNIETFGGNPKEDNEIFFYTRKNSNYSDELLGTATFKRISNKTKGYDETYWQDKVYGDETNSVTVSLVREAMNIDSSWKVISDTPYFYTDPQEGIPRRLYIFGETEVQSFTIESTQSLANLNYTLLNFKETEEGDFIETSEASEGLVNSFNNYFKLGQEDSQFGNVGISYSNDNKTATIRLRSKSQDPCDWFPKCSSNGKPIRIKISYSSEDENDPLNGRCEIFYAVVKPSFVGSELTFRDISSNEYPILEEYTFPENGGVLPTYIVGPAEGNAGVFNHWIVLKKDPEIDVKFQGKPEEGSVTYSCNLITKTQTAAWPSLGFLTEISTKSMASSSLTRNFDDLVIRRAAKYYESITEYYIDWLNQLCEHSTTNLKLILGGASESKTLKVSYEKGGLDNEVMELHNTSLLPLREIGIYRLNVKSEHPFRVTLIDNDEEKSIIGFYDPANDVIKKSTMLDVNTYDNVTGSNVDLLFLGYEEDGFSTYAPTLRFNTRIQVTNLYDNTSVSFGIERTYYHVSDDAWKEEIYSEITPIEPKSLNVFIPVGEKDVNIKYTSAIETYRMILGYNGINWTRTITEKPEFTRDLYYSDLVYHISQNVDLSVPSHGYKRHNLNVSIGLISNAGTSYPIKCFGGINLNYQGEYLGESKKYRLYKLLGVPTPTITTYSSDNSVPGAFVLPYNSNTSIPKVMLSVPVNGNYRLYFLRAESDTPTEINKIGQTSIVIYGSNSETLTFMRDPNSETYELTLSGSNASQNYITLGTLYATSYVDKDNFAIDENGEPLILTQNEVDKITGVGITAKIPVLWGTGDGTGDYIIGNLSRISREGETRTFTIHSADNVIDQTTFDNTLASYNFLNTFGYHGEFESYDIGWKRLLDQIVRNSGSIHDMHQYSNTNYIELEDNNDYDLIKTGEGRKFEYLQYLHSQTTGGGINRSITIDGTDLKIPVVQENWGKGILGRRVNSRYEPYTYEVNSVTKQAKKYLFLGNQNKNVDILATATEGHVFLELYPVQVPSVSDATYDVLESDENKVILRSLISEPDSDGVIDENLVIDYDQGTGIEIIKTISAEIEGSTNRKIYLDISVPTNNSFYDYQVGEDEYSTITEKSMGPYEIRVTDEDYNSITYNIYVSPRKELTLKAYQEITETGNTDSINLVPEGKISSVLLSASGSLFGLTYTYTENNTVKTETSYQDYFYIVTNATDEMLKTGLQVNCDSVANMDNIPIWNSPETKDFKYTGIAQNNGGHVMYYYDSSNSRYQTKSYVLLPNLNVNADLYCNLDYEYIGDSYDGGDKRRVYKVKSFNAGVSKIWSTRKEDIFGTIEIPELDSNGFVTTRLVDGAYTNTVTTSDGYLENPKMTANQGIVGLILDLQKNGAGTNFPVINGAYIVNFTLSVGSGRTRAGLTLRGYHGHGNIALSSPRIPVLSVKAFADTMISPGIYNVLPTPIVEKYMDFEYGLDQKDVEEYNNFYQPGFETGLSANSNYYTESLPDGTTIHCVDINDTILINYTASSTFKNKIFSKYGFLGGFLIKNIIRGEFINSSVTENLFSSRARSGNGKDIKERIHFVQGNSRTGLVLTPISSSGLSETYKIGSESPITQNYSEPSCFMPPTKIYKDHLENIALRRRTRDDNPTTLQNLLVFHKSYDPGVVILNESENYYTSAIFNGNTNDSEFGTIFLRDILVDGNNETRVYSEQGMPGIILNIPKSKFTNIGNNIYEYTTDEIYISDIQTMSDNSVYSTPKFPIRIKLRIKL